MESYGRDGLTIARDDLTIARNDLNIARDNRGLDAQCDQRARDGLTLARNEPNIARDDLNIARDEVGMKRAALGGHKPRVAVGKRFAKGCGQPAGKVHDRLPFKRVC
jgi:hypothetical protein